MNITDRHSLVSHCRELAACSATTAENIADIILNRDDCPRWGADWAAFFDRIGEREWLNICAVADNT